MPRTGVEPASPDLLILVDEQRDGGRIAFHFRLKTRDPELGLKFASFRAEPLRRDPLPDFADLFRDLEKIPRRDEAEQRAAERRLASLGTKLFDELLPLELRRALWRVHPYVRTVEVVSNETWVPWELLKLRDPDRDDAFGPFFAEAFALTRWLQGREEVPAFPLERLALVVPGDSQLPHAAAERDAVRSHAPGEVIEVPARYLELTDALASGRFDAWHFTGHGLARGGNPEDWSLQLEVGHRLRPADLRGEARRLGRTQPLIFLNACHSGRGGDALAGAGGLAAAFLEAGAGALVAAHWALPDERARTFAEAFYAHFVTAGETFGEAVRQARRALRQACPGDPTWLAYTAFAHPLAVSRPAGERSEPVSPPTRAPAPPTAAPIPAREVFRSPAPTPAGTTPSRRRIMNRATLAAALIGAAATLVAGLMTSPWTPWNQGGSDTEWLVRVAKPDGSPVSGAKVIFYTESGVHQDTTDGNGAAQLELDSTRRTSGRLVIQAPGYAIYEQSTGPNRESWINARLSLPEPTSANVLFRVVDPGGAPVSGAEVQLLVGADPFQQVTDGTGLAKFPVSFDNNETDVRLTVVGSCRQERRLTLQPETVQDVRLDCALEPDALETVPP